MPRGRGTTESLADMARGDPDARDEVFRRLFDELRAVAGRVRWNNDRRATLETTDLIGAAYERLVKAPEGGFQSRDHFLARAAIAMRHVLIDHARARAANKRGGQRQRVGEGVLDTIAARLEEQTGGLIEFDGALARLGVAYPRARQVVDLRVFGGYSVAEVARLLGISVRAVEREWTFAKTWLKAEAT